MFSFIFFQKNSYNTGNLSRPIDEKWIFLESSKDCESLSKIYLRYYKSFWKSPNISKQFNQFSSIIMLRHKSRKQHRKILPPSPPPPQKKKTFFWGGGGERGSIFWIKSSIFYFGWDNKLWRDFGTERTLWTRNPLIFGQYRPKTHNWNFKNMIFFSSILRKFRDFCFFQSDNLVQNHPNMITQIFLQSFFRS